MKTTSRFQFVCVWIIALAVAPGLFAERKTALRGTRPERLLAAASKSHMTVVIVGVRVPGGWRAADTRIPAKAADQRRRSITAKEQLLRAHPGAHRVVDRDFDLTPFFTLEVDEPSLRRLMNDDDVTSIEANDGFSVRPGTWVTR